RRLRPAGGQRVPLRGRVRGGDHARRVGRGRRRGPLADPAVHDGPRGRGPSQPRTVPLAPPPLEAPAQAAREGESRQPDAFAGLAPVVSGCQLTAPSESPPGALRSRTRSSPSELSSRAARAFTVTVPCRHRKGPKWVRSAEFESRPHRAPAA